MPRCECLRVPESWRLERPVLRSTWYVKHPAPIALPRTNLVALPRPEGFATWTSPPGVYSYVTLVSLRGRTELLVTIRGQDEALLLLSNSRGQPFEIVIGPETKIRPGPNGVGGTAITNDILSPLEDRMFWIRWNPASIALGRVCVAM